MKTWYTERRYLRLVLQYYCKRIVINFNVHLICTSIETIRGHLATCLATMYNVQNKVAIIIMMTLLPPRSLVRLRGGSQ